MDSSGKIVTGFMVANNDVDLELRVDKMNMDLISFKSESKSSLFTKKISITRTELINLTFHLEQLAKAGVPLVNSIEDLRDSVESSVLREVLSSIVEAIQAGSKFSESLKDYPTIFDEVYVSMIEVAEKTGKLGEVLHDLAEMIRWQDELISKSKKILIYPAFVFSVVFAVMLFLMVYLVPQLSGFLTNFDTELPFYTAALIATSNFISGNWYIIVAVPIIIPIFITIGVKNSQSFHFSYDQFKLKMPLIGPISYRIKLARFANYFALMYSSGITVLESIELSKKIMANLALEDALQRVHNQIADGESISSSFATVGLFSPLIIRMVSIGETTGEMDVALKNVSYFYTREVTEKIEKIEPAIQPIITVFLGLMVCWIILSVMAPIYDIMLTIG
jgi:type IV pilus assembly protein PilC